MTLDVEDEGRIVSTQQVTLPTGGAPATVPVRFTVDEAGPRVLRFRVPPQAGELVAENNQREALIDVRDRREKILYFEGEPRFELKFIRRAVTEDKQRRASSPCSAPPTTSTCAWASTTPTSWSPAFPKTREELFAYRGLILGSIEAGAFTGDQLRMIARVRRSPRRRAADARRAARVQRRRLRRHRGGRRAAGGARSQQRCSRRTARDAAARCKPTRAGAGQRRHADGRHRGGVGGAVEHAARS